MTVLMTQIVHGTGYECAVEVTNQGTVAEDISGYSLVYDNIGFDQTIFTFPSGTVIQAGEAFSVAQPFASFAAQADFTAYLLFSIGNDRLVFRDASGAEINGHDLIYLAPNTNLELGPTGWTGTHYDSGIPSGLDLVCFLAGTMISTSAGEVAIEDLATGQLVATADGRLLSVRWIGRQTVAVRFADPLKTAPICIRAGALADNMPSRDLHTSAGHAMLVDGVLVIAGAMVNGQSIVRTKPATPRITYYHVELDEHAIIFANGAPTESFVDNVNREVFDNHADYKAMYPDAKPIIAMDLPLVKSARQLPAETKRRLAARAATIDAASDKAA